jgi:hypothetical protein
MNDIRDHLLTRSINISCTHRSLPRLVTRTAPSDVDFRQSTRDDDDIDDDSPTEMPTEKLTSMRLVIRGCERQISHRTTSLAPAVLIVHFPLCLHEASRALCSSTYIFTIGETGL